MTFILDELSKGEVMKKLFTVWLLGLVLSIPSVVFAEASWYGSIRTGIESDHSNDTGVADFASRWGIQGSNEVSEGLTAVYRYERKIRSNDAFDDGGRLSYVGLSGGFGTVTVGKVWGAAYNHFGEIVDQALWFGSTGETGDRFADAVSYSVSVGNVSLQADTIMDQSEDKTVDAFNFGATLGGLMETGSVAIAHRKHPDVGTLSESSSYIAGNYGIGDVTVFLGYSQDLRDDSSCTTAPDNDECHSNLKTKITYAGVHGGVGDTGVSYVFTMRNLKLDVSGFEDTNTNVGNITSEATKFSRKENPWTLGLSRSLGGGASLKFEHSEPDRDQDDVDSSTAVWLQVDF